MDAEASKGLSTQNRIATRTQASTRFIVGPVTALLMVVRFEWSKGDYFIIPNFAWHEHVANEDSYLFSTSDLPMMEKFNVERKEAYESNNGYQEVKDEFKPLLG